MRALILAFPMAILSLSGAMAGGAGWSGARTEVVWTGVYAGLQAGYTHAELKDRVQNMRAERDFGDFSGGVYVGYMQQMASGFVLGLETDLNITNLRRTGAAKVYQGSAYLGEEDVYDRIKWTGGLRARAGYALGQFMPYVTGGLGIAKYRGEDTNDKAYGWSLGAGAEYAVTESLVARVEYRYSDYGDAKTDVLVGEGATARLKTSLTAHDVRVGVGLKF
ncbi:outer membrane protein [Neomegalonema sp.]|uniref:outer membrane protein n=1 Tax=Neomegalonema sp. TaxID=2039713 RepID=UPI002628A43A|nr:outer membrane protein [Neomegalonema sp.]MDD2870320.1 porin family protein [Neomegalonema sp.]